MLKREGPKIKGVKEGDKILKTNNFFEEIPQVISNLDNSYIYLQGPPGTGKTTQAANDCRTNKKRQKNCNYSKLS